MNSPWVEKYRPIDFDNIVLQHHNKRILKNILNSKYFPNLLLYGPPGTGKTTTIINMIKKYQIKNNETHKNLVMHLNASDDRGIDIIRNQIIDFVNSSVLFNNGTKFIILDEVDYMTEKAQLALKNIIQKYNNKVCFCLICNYISKINTSLKNEFIIIIFDNLPENLIYNYLLDILNKENVSINNEHIKEIQTIYGSDIRSMINYIQLNHSFLDRNISKNNYDNISEYLKKNDVKNACKIISDQCGLYNKNRYDYTKSYIKDLIINKKIDLSYKIIKVIENIYHDEISNDNILIYSILEYICKYIN